MGFSFYKSIVRCVEVYNGLSKLRLLFGTDTNSIGKCNCVKPELTWSVNRYSFNSFQKVVQ